MSESSGIFTFPSTGVYKIEFNAHFSKNGEIGQINSYIMTTTNNSSYSEASYSQVSIKQAQSNYTGQSSHNCFIFNVTNTTTHKVRFDITGSAPPLIQADTNANTTYMTFIRLGDSV